MGKPLRGSRCKALPPDLVGLTISKAVERSPGCLREGAKSYAKPAPARRGGPGTPVQEARTFWPCSRNWPCGPACLERPA